MQVQQNPVIATLSESRDEVISLSDFLFREGFWSDDEAKRMIAETRDAQLIS